MNEKDAKAKPDQAPEVPQANALAVAQALIAADKTRRANEMIRRMDEAAAELRCSVTAVITANGSTAVAAIAVEAL